MLFIPKQTAFFFAVFFCMSLAASRVVVEEFRPPVLHVVASFAEACGFLFLALSGSHHSVSSETSSGRERN